MSWKEVMEPLLVRMPEVQRPTGHVPFKRKLIWTMAVLVTYFIMTNILLFGLADGGAGGDVFGQFRSILAGSSGTLLQLGIGPIVTGSIVLQLLSGVNLLGLDTQDDPRDQAIYQGLQKFLTIIVAIMSAIPLVFGSGFLPVNTQLAATLGIGAFALKLLMFAQVVFGGVLIIYLDEIVSRWGVGSGVGLFIIAGVSQRFIGGLVSVPQLTGNTGVIPEWINIALGNTAMPSPFTSEGLIALLFNQGNIIPILTTIFIFVVVVYAESVRVEIPLQHARVKGARGRFPVKLIYASVLPMILVRAVQMNIQFLGQIIHNQLGAAATPDWFAVYSSGQPVEGIMYFLSPVRSPQQWMWWLGAPQEPGTIILRVLIDLTIMVVGGAIFAIFWVDTADMGPDSVANQIQGTGMQIPGFRQNQQSYERVLRRYIPQVTVLGGALVGFLAVMANLLGTIGGVSGTGLLLTISITYKLYQEVAEEKMMDMHPMMRKMFGGD